MGTKTKIEWTATVHKDGSVTEGSTWNPVEGCSMAKGSETGGCLNCYAAREALRRPSSGLAVMRDSGPRWTGKVGIVEKHLKDPMHWRKPRRVFVNSMSDLFHESLPNEAIDRVFNVMALCPQHTFQILTKRAERMLAYMLRRARQQAGIRANECPSLHSAWPDVLPNVWLGVSVENQPTADARISVLLKTPAAKRFVSYEPGLGPVDFRLDERRFDLDWIIVGGESGPGARPFNVRWARSTVRQCRNSGVLCFVKQLGSLPVMEENDWHAIINATGRAPMLSASKAKYCPAGYVALALHDRKGGDMEEWSPDLRVREFPK